MVESIELVILSFFASFGFGIVFRLVGKDLLWAGLSGALTRCVYLILLSVIDSRLVCVMLAAMIAALYAEVLATKKKMPSTVFLYPAIIPLIPGDLFLYTVMNLVVEDYGMTLQNGKDCILTLACMSVGFVLSSTIAYYIRRHKLGIHIEKNILMATLKGMLAEK